MLYFPNIQSYTIEDQNKRTKDPPHFRSIERERENTYMTKVLLEMVQPYMTDQTSECSLVWNINPELSK